MVFTTPPDLQDHEMVPFGHADLVTRKAFNKATKAHPAVLIAFVAPCACRCCCMQTVKLWLQGVKCVALRSTRMQISPRSSAGSSSPSTGAVLVSGGALLSGPDRVDASKASKLVKTQSIINLPHLVLYRCCAHNACAR